VFYVISVFIFGILLVSFRFSIKFYFFLDISSERMYDCCCKRGFTVTYGFYVLFILRFLM
jgi:hypothetical protein